MKFKHITLVILITLFVKNAFADGKYDPIIKQNIVYILPSGNKVVDDEIESSFAKYWTVTPYKIFPKNDTDIQGDFPVFVIADEGADNYIVKLHMMTINLANEKTVKKKQFSFSDQWTIVYTGFTMPDFKVGFEQGLFTIPEAIQLFNTKVSYYKKYNKELPPEEVNKQSARIKDLTLLIPEEYTIKTKWDVNIIPFCLMNKDAIDAYRYNYKIVPFATISDLLSDSVEASKYCYLHYSYNEPLYIFDGATNDCLLLVGGNSAGSYIRKSDMTHISDIIQGLKTK